MHRILGTAVAANLNLDRPQRHVVLITAPSQRAPSRRITDESLVQAAQSDATLPLGALESPYEYSIK